ncbi:MAG: ADP-ribosylglycohydrolase family protein [Paracoccaceae bacterium]
MTHSRTSEMLLGALVSDAACLGLHWLYDAERIAEITACQDGDCAFTPVDAANFEGTKGYFAHGARAPGSLTQYGEVLRLAIARMAANNGNFDTATYQDAFAAFFGPGGAYNGYIDRPTRGALDNIANEVSPPGIDDDQNPAVARLPAIIARYQHDAQRDAKIAEAMQVTNVNDVGLAYNRMFADVLSDVMEGKPILDALQQGVQNAPALIKSETAHALSTSESNSTVFAGEVGRACHLPTAGPVVFHILKHSKTYAEAINANILAGGDSAGRSIMVGAIMGAAHGLSTPKGIPLAWVLKLKDAGDIWGDCTQLGTCVTGDGA